MPKKVLIVEDDANIAELLHLYLEKEGFETQVAKDGGKGVELFRSFQPDLVLLDIMLPIMDGWSVLKKIREGDRTPVIMLTAKGETEDKVSGLEQGADDYIVKPFEMKEVLARIRAVLRRQEKFSEAEDTLFCGNIVLDKRKTTVTAGGEKVELTSGEFRLLAYLMENKNRTLTRNALLSRLWDDEGDYVNDNTLTVTVGRLREKLGEQSRRFLKTVRGIGYQMEDCGD